MHRPRTPLLLATALALLATVQDAPATAEGFVDLTTDLFFDDNENRARPRADQRADAGLAAEVSLGWRFDVGARSSFTLAGVIGGGLSDRFSGLDHADAGVVASWRSKLGLGPTAPTLRAALEARHQEFDGPLRSGTTSRASVRLAKRWSDTWAVASTVSADQRDADDATFDHRGISLQIAAEATIAATVFSLRLFGRDGDVTSVATPNATILAAAEVKADDAVYEPGWVAYRLDGRTLAFGLGLDHPVGDAASVAVRIDRQLTHTTGDLDYANTVFRAGLTVAF